MSYGESWKEVGLYSYPSVLTRVLATPLPTPAKLRFFSLLAVLSDSFPGSSISFCPAPRRVRCWRKSSCRFLAHLPLPWPFSMVLSPRILTPSAALWWFQTFFPNCSFLVVLGGKCWSASSFFHHDWKQKSTWIVSWKSTISNSSAYPCLKINCRDISEM